MSSENSNNVVWTRTREGKTQSEPMLIGRKLSPEWLGESVSVMEIRFAGDLMRAFSDLMEAGRNIRKKLPVRALRVALIGVVDRVVTIDQDLGLNKIGTSPAISVMQPAPEEREAIRTQIMRELRLWVMNTVEPWAEYNSIGELAARIKPLIVKESIELADVPWPLMRKGGVPDYGLIARVLGEKLIGERLFPGLSECELVATQDTGNSIELMTLPTNEPRGDKVFSMVCRLTVCTIPYSTDVYVGVSAMKRVWANKMPGIRFSMPTEVTGYVVSAGRPVIAVPVSRRDGSWEFSDGYAALRAESASQLPETLKQAIEQQEFNIQANWWAGIPELKTLFRRVSSSTVFESDEVDLLHGVSSLLGSVLSSHPIQIREVPLIRYKNKIQQEMLRISDLDGAAGDSLVSEGEDALEGGQEQEDDAATRHEKLLRYREQNQSALALVGGTKRMLWVMGGSADEQALIRKSAIALFGDSIQINTEPLPAGTHGLRSDLDQPSGTSRQRFDQRVTRWQAVTPTIQSVSKDHQILALICAPDTVGNKPEDQVNYYAGIHALSSINANVHHVLPTEKPDDPKSRQAFLHRTQSALLDVFLAHSGVVLNTQDFMSRLHPADTMPKMVYGIQALRSNARRRSGESRVCFLLYSRLTVATGITEINIIYKGKTKNQVSGWMPLASALQWVGTQRSLHEGDENWLKENFLDVTRDAIIEMQATDPRAIVMIDWECVRGLWKGIRDEDLKTGSAKLGEVPLSMFSGLSFVRLRGGPDTLSLREGSRTTYNGMTNGQPNGEILVDSYYTTGKNLIEVVEERVPNPQVGHFIATMGYAKTVQLKRGFSCYRPMPRVQKISKELSEYKQIILEPGNMDASLPAAMDITVLHAPTDTQLEHIAMTVMGLRLGYAHYNDWTRLPAPLFFRRKIEDYIIRFPEVEADEVIVTVAVEEEIAEEDVTTGTQLEMLFSEEDLDAMQPGAELSIAVTEPEVGEKTEDEDAELPSCDDLLSRARTAKMACMFQRETGNVPLYKRMFQDNTGEVQVHVTLPYWLKTTDLFGTYTPTIRRMSSRIWDALRDRDYVRKFGVTKPKDAELLNWLSAKLRIPQGIHGILNVTGAIGRVEFQPLSAIIRDEFNQGLDIEERIDSRAILSDDNIRRLTKWANEKSHDEMMGWIVFTAAQMGFSEFCRIIFEETTHIPGPRTEDALDYYLACSEVIHEVLAAGSHKRININRHRTEHPAAKEAQLQVALVKAETATVDMKEIQLVLEDPIPYQQEEGSPLMTIKNKLVELIQHLTPGKEDFESGIAAINGVLEELSSIHRVALEQQGAEALLRDRFDALRANCEALISALMTVKESLELGEYHYSEPEIAMLDTAIAQVDEIQALLDEFNTLNAALEDLGKLPPATSVMERARRNAKEGETLDAIMEVGTKVKSKLDECACIVPNGELPPPQDKMPLPQPTAEEKPQAEAAAVETLAVEGVASMIESAEMVVAPDVAAVDSVVTHAGVETEEVVVAPIIKPEPTSVIGAIEHTTESAIEEDESADLQGADFNEIDNSIGILNGLIKQRYYGLAEIHVEALKYLLANAHDASTSNHHTVLRALVYALYAMDCQFEFDTGLDSDLQGLLDNSELPGGTLCESHFAALGVLAASMSSMLFASPEVQWSIGNAIGSRLQGHKALSDLIQHIDDVRRQGLVVTRDMYLSSHIGEKSAIEIELTRFKKRAEEWKNGHEIFSNWNHRGFRKVHDDIYGPRHSVGYCLSLIAKGETDRVKVTYEELRRVMAKPAALIDETFKKIGERTQPDGMYRDRAIENLEKTKAFIENYLENARRRENPSNELNRNVQHFLSGLHNRLNESLKEVAAIQPSTNIEHVYRDAAVVAINSALKLFENTPPAICIPQDKQKLLIQLPMARDLMPVMEPVDAKTPALVTPREVFRETARWVNEKLRMDDSGDSIDAALRESMRMHIDNKRFIPAWRIAKMLNVSESIVHGYNTEKNEFKARLQEAKQRVTHAMTLSALQQDEANSMQRIIDKMLSGVQTQFGIGHPDGDPSTVADFQQAIAALNCNVTKPLKARLNEAAADLRKRLDDYAEKQGSEAMEDVKRIRAIIGDGGNAANLRTAFDAMVMLNANQRLPKRLGETVDVATEYDEFMHQVHVDIGNDKRPLDAMLDRLKQSPHAGDPKWLAVLSAEDRADAVELITSWTEMFIKGNERFDAKMLNGVMQKIGINHVPDVIPESGRQQRIKFFLDQRAFTFPNSHEDDVFIPPVLGSWATHLEGYLITGMPQETDLRQAMIGIGGTPTMILCRNHFNMQKRARICGNLPVLLVDDDLIAYIALHPAERLQCLMRISILTFSTNPYDDYGGRPVPTEMFFGRQKELSKLRDVKSVGVLYGGRRLGKSSLLAQIVQESGKVPGNAAVYISMETVSSGPEYLESAWEHLYFALVKKNIIQPNNSARSSNAKVIKDWIEKELTSRADLKSLYLLIDEADTLMGCELRYSSGENSFVKQLVHLIDSVHTCKVRYVIAGLHNMTRMATEENSVFGKVEPIALEPFNTQDDFQRGISLITKPLAAMGFLFAPDKQDLPLRILSVCNFYPAFIQLYCKRLVDRLQNNRQSGKPPVYITEQDLDAVENDDTLLSELRGKFELNLNLDKRYKAIALILADVYYSDIEKGQYIGLTVPEIREYCESFCGKHFAHTGAGAYEALLDEMVKLNVLERTQGSRYLLRNPNIAMMMGDRERVSSKLDELAREKPNESRNHSERRIAMTHHNHAVHFPMPIGWIRSQTEFIGKQEDATQDGELIVLSGSKMSGLEEVVSGLGRDEWALGHSVVVSAMLGSGPDAANDYISKMRRGSQAVAVQRLMMVRPNAWTVRQITDFANVASRAARFGVRIALLAPPERSFELAMSIDKNEVKPGMIDSARGWSVVPVPVWSDDAIFFHMSENVAVSQDAAALHAIQEATCGFGKEVIKLCSNSLPVQDALNAPKVHGAKFAGSLKDIYENVGIPAAFTEDRRREMETFLAFLDGMKRNTFEADELRKECGISQGEMDFMFWMGLLQGGPNGTWRVPTLYRNLINQ